MRKHKPTETLSAHYAPTDQQTSKVMVIAAAFVVVFADVVIVLLVPLAQQPCEE
jgi:hypothetical protein